MSFCTSRIFVLLWIKYGSVVTSCWLLKFSEDKKKSNQSGCLTSQFINRTTMGAGSNLNPHSIQPAYTLGKRHSGL